MSTVKFEMNMIQVPDVSCSSPFPYLFLLISPDGICISGIFESSLRMRLVVDDMKNKFAMRFCKIYSDHRSCMSSFR